MTKTLNLDVLFDEKKELVIGGKTFDVTRTPVAIFLMIQKQARGAGITLDWYREPLTDWLKESDPSVTKEWVDSVTSDTQVLRAIERNLFDPIITDPLPEWISDQPIQDPETKPKR